jgi:hypothetical protein
MHTMHLQLCPQHNWRTRSRGAARRAPAPAGRSPAAAAVVDRSRQLRRPAGTPQIVHNCGGACDRRPSARPGLAAPASSVRTLAWRWRVHRSHRAPCLLPGQAAADLWGRQGPRRPPLRCLPWQPAGAPLGAGSRFPAAVLTVLDKRTSSGSCIAPCAQSRDERAEPHEPRPPQLAKLRAIRPRPAQARSAAPVICCPRTRRVPQRATPPPPARPVVWLKPMRRS